MRRRACVVILTAVLAWPCLQGCAETVIVGGGGKIGSAKDRAPVLVTENGKDVVGCEFMMNFEQSRPWGGLLLQEDAMERVITDLTYETVDAGGNVLLIRKKQKGFNGSSASGDVYRCPDNNAPAPPPQPTPK
jgi:hypothetical protein